MPNDLTHDASHNILTILHILITQSIPRTNPSQRLLITRATELLTIIHILITRAIPRANASQRSKGEEMVATVKNLVNESALLLLITQAIALLMILHILITRAN